MRHSAPLSISAEHVSILPSAITIEDLPLGKKPRTLTTTRTLPPPLSGVLRPIGMISDSLARSDGEDADDLGRTSA